MQDDTAQHDDVGRLDGARLLEQVGDDERRPVADVRGLGQLGRRAAVGRHDSTTRPAAAPRRISSTWIWPMPPPTSATVVPSRPPSSAHAAIWRASTSKSLAQVPPQRTSRASFAEDVERFGRAAGRHAGILPDRDVVRPGPRGSGLRDARLEGGAERLAHRVELDPVEHVLEEEPAHDQPLGSEEREAACCAR